MVEKMQESQVYKIYYDRENDWITMDWKGYATSREFRAGTERMLEELIRHKATRVFGNIRDMVLISQDDQNWLVEEFLPRAIELGMQHTALVTPVHYFNKVAVESVAYKMEKEKLSIQFFQSVEEAQAWLRDRKVP
jgi:hypothetical protein